MDRTEFNKFDPTEILSKFELKAEDIPEESVDLAFEHVNSNTSGHIELASGCAALKWIGESAVFYMDAEPTNVTLQAGIWLLAMGWGT